MCYPKPGPRCATEARKSLTLAKQRFAEITADPKQDRLTDFTKARTALEKAQADWFMTSEGIKELKTAGKTSEAAFYEQKRTLAIAASKQVSVQRASSKNTPIPDLNRLLNDRNSSRETKRAAAKTLAAVHPIWSAFDSDKAVGMLLGKGVPA
jgi:hypothetical protein